VTGYIVGRTQSFTNAFLVAGVVLLVGVAAFVFLLGRIEPLPEPEMATPEGVPTADPPRAGSSA